MINIKEMDKFKLLSIVLALITVILIIVIVVLTSSNQYVLVENSSQYVLECWKATNIEGYGACQYLNGAINN